MTELAPLSDGLVKLEQIVKPLQWLPAWLGRDGVYARTPFRETYFAYSTGRWDDLAGSAHQAGSSLDEAKAAAEADYRARIASALNIDPILSEIKRMREALAWYGERSASLAKTMAGQRLEAMTGRDANYVIAILTELSLDAGRRALPTLSPQEPDRS